MKYYYEILNDGDEIEILIRTEAIDYLDEFESAETDHDDIVQAVCKERNFDGVLVAPGSYIVMLYGADGDFIGKFNVELEYYTSFFVEKVEGGA
jgi:hypothetical protein